MSEAKKLTREEFVKKVLDEQKERRKRKAYIIREYRAESIERHYRRNRRKG